MKTADVLFDIRQRNQKVYRELARLRQGYKNGSYNNGEIASYVRGLRDTEFISDRDRQVLYIYLTL